MNWQLASQYYEIAVKHRKTKRSCRVFDQWLTLVLKCSLTEIQDFYRVLSVPNIVELIQEAINERG